MLQTRAMYFIGTQSYCNSLKFENPNNFKDYSFSLFLFHILFPSPAHEFGFVIFAMILQASFFGKPLLQRSIL